MPIGEDRSGSLYVAVATGGVFRLENHQPISVARDIVVTNMMVQELEERGLADSAFTGNSRHFKDCGVTMSHSITRYSAAPTAWTRRSAALASLIRLLPVTASSGLPRHKDWLCWTSRACRARTASR